MSLNQTSQSALKYIYISVACADNKMRHFTNPMKVIMTFFMT